MTMAVNKYRKEDTSFAINNSGRMILYRVEADNSTMDEYCPWVFDALTVENANVDESCFS